MRVEGDTDDNSTNCGTTAGKTNKKSQRDRIFSYGNAAVDRNALNSIDKRKRDRLRQCKKTNQSRERITKTKAPSVVLCLAARKPCCRRCATRYQSMHCAKSPSDKKRKTTPTTTQKNQCIRIPKRLCASARRRRSSCLVRDERDKTET
jgi:hypothetical protein